MADTDPFAKYATPVTAPAAPSDDPFAKYAAPPEQKSGTAPAKVEPEKIYYNDAGQPFTASGKPPPVPSESYTGAILPLSVDKSGTHLAVPEMIASPVRGAIEGGKRALGIGEGGANPLRQLSPDTQAAALTFGGAKPFSVGQEPIVSKIPSPAKGVPPEAFDARKAGYVLPPAYISDKPGLISNVLAGWSGKIKTQQAASTKNQMVTNDLAAQALGLPKGTVLTDQVFSQIRQNAGQAYQAVENAIPAITADAQYDATVASLGGKNSQAAQLFPKITSNPGIKDMVEELKSVPTIPTPAAVEIVKELRFNGNANLKAQGDPSKHALGLAQRQAADAIDELMERNLSATGQGDLVNAYRQARQLIARTYDVEGATNIATGDVNARGLARLAIKGRPLTGELDTIANAAAAFPKAMQVPAGFGGDEKFSGLDFFGAMLAAGHGRFDVAGAIAGRPVARGAVLSGPMQNRITNERPPMVRPPSTEGMVRGVLPGGLVGNEGDPAQRALGLQE